MYQYIYIQEREREIETSGEGLFVVANILDSGGDFPVERTEEVEDSNYEEKH